MTQERAEVDRDVELAIRVAVRELRGQKARLYLLGSRARRDAGRASDIDIGVAPEVTLEVGTLARIREALEENTISYEVDVVDLSTVDRAWRERILAEAIPWNV